MRGGERIIVVGIGGASTIGDRPDRMRLAGFALVLLVRRLVARAVQIAIMTLIVWRPYCIRCEHVDAHKRARGRRARRSRSGPHSAMGLVGSGANTVDDIETEIKIQRRYTSRTLSRRDNYYRARCEEVWQWNCRDSLRADGEARAPSERYSGRAGATIIPENVSQSWLANTVGGARISRFVAVVFVAQRWKAWRRSRYSSRQLRNCQAVGRRGFSTVLLGQVPEGGEEDNCATEPSEWWVGSFSPFLSPRPTRSRMATLYALLAAAASPAIILRSTVPHPDCISGDPAYPATPALCSLRAEHRRQFHHILHSFLPKSNRVAHYHFGTAYAWGRCFAVSFEPKKRT